MRRHKLLPAGRTKYFSGGSAKQVESPAATSPFGLGRISGNAHTKCLPVPKHKGEQVFRQGSHVGHLLLCSPEALGYTYSHLQLQGKKRNKKSLVPQKTAVLERLAGDAGEDKKLLDIGPTEKMAALSEQAAKQAKGKTINSTRER